MARRRPPSNYQVLFSYALPYFVYVGCLMVPESVLAREWAYALALAATLVALRAVWRWYVPLRGPGSVAGSTAAGVAGGVAGTALWVAVKAPFYEAGGEPWEPAAFWMRLVASGTVVAVFEEMLFRGWALRAALQWQSARAEGVEDPLGVALHERSISDVEPGAWTWLAVVFSSVVFAAGHAPGEWPAAIAYGLLMAGLWIWRKDLLSCVVAHGTTNVTLAFYVLATGQWEAW